MMATTRKMSVQSNIVMFGCGLSSGLGPGSLVVKELRSFTVGLGSGVIAWFFVATGDMVGDKSATFSDRLSGAGGGIAGGLKLHLGVYLGTKQDKEPREIEPELQ